MPSCLCRTVIVISIMDKQNNKCNIWGINTIENLFIIGWFIGMTSSCSLLSIYSKHSIFNIFSIMVFLYTTHSIPSFFIIIFSLYHTVFLYITHNTLYLYNYVYFIHVPQFFFIRQTLYSKSSLFTLFSWYQTHYIHTNYNSYLYSCMAVPEYPCACGVHLC